MDANINRSREGLRVVEDIARFIMDHPDLASEIKLMRHEITSLAKRLPFEESEFLSARDSFGDVGMDLNCASEDLRVDLQEIAEANVHRSQEALRVLEEFSKLYDADVGQSFKKLRFRLYDLEKEVLRGLAEYLAQTRENHAE